MDYPQVLRTFVQDIFDILDANGISSLEDFRRHCELKFTPSPTPLSVVFTKRNFDPDGSYTTHRKREDEIYKILCFYDDERNMPLTIYLFPKKDFSRISVFYDRPLPGFLAIDKTDSSGRRMYLREIPSSDLPNCRRSLFELDTFLMEDL